MKRVLVLLTCLMFAACGGSDGPTSPNGGNTGGNNNGGGNNNPPPDDGTPTVTLNELSFSPSTLTVNAGETVVWENDSSATHTITPDGHSQWTRVVTSGTGEVLRVTFSTKGSYEYHCEFHSGMNGTIVVQ